MYYNVQFKGLHTHDPEHAIKLYRERIGKEPTVILVRPDYPVRQEHPLLVRSVAGTAVYMLITHEITMEEVQKTETEWREKQKQVLRKDFDNLAQFNFEYRRQVREAMELEGSGMKKPPLPQKATCPHCKQDLHDPDFENLGWWWGWEDGIEPPYWGMLRLYVFKRDDYKCYTCGEEYPAYRLNAHHIIPKENGGIDSAKNLQTMCVTCHQDGKPIFQEDNAP